MTNVPEEVVRARLRRGWSLVDATTRPVQKTRNRKYPEEYIRKAEKLGVSADTFRSRVKHGMSLEVAATTPVISFREMGLRSVEAHKRRKEGLMK